MEGKIETYTAVARSKNFNTQVFISLVLKGTSVALNLLLVPLYLQFLGQERYGVWVTLIASANWVIFMDIGIGNGMRNKVSEALSGGDFIAAREYVSTAYFALGSIVVTIILLTLVIFNFLDFSAIFNTTAITEQQLKIGALIVVLSIMLNFLLGLANAVLNALQKNSFISVGLIVGNALLLLIFLLFSHDVATESRFLFIAGAYSLCLLSGSLLLTFFTFKYNPRLTPNLRFFDTSKIKSIGSLGSRFFILEIAVVVILTTDSLIIAQLYGAAEVTPYFVTQKIFQIAIILASILVEPFWSATTEAFSKGDVEWIKNKLSFLLKIFMVYTVFVLALIFAFPEIKNRWVGEAVIVPDSLPVFMGMYVILWFWNNIFNKILNGLSVLHTQLLMAILGIITNIPLCLFFAKTLNMGLSGIIMGANVLLVISAVIYPIQSYLLLENKASGIWLKK